MLTAAGCESRAIREFEGHGAAMLIVLIFVAAT